MLSTKEARRQYAVRERHKAKASQRFRYAWITDQGPDGIAIYDGWLRRLAKEALIWMDVQPTVRTFKRWWLLFGPLDFVNNDECFRFRDDLLAMTDRLRMEHLVDQEGEQAADFAYRQPMTEGV